MVKVKICGITNLEDAQVAIKAGCDALGFLFYRRSPRYISPVKAAGVIKKIPLRIIKIGVFVNAPEEEIRRIAKLCKLNILQFHGSESPEFCAKFKDYKIIKVFRIKNKAALKDVFKYRTFAYLFDTFVRNKIGGTGRSFNWKLIAGIKGMKQSIFLSGGLTEKNVSRAIRALRPDWVDASSSLEIEPGRKNHDKLLNFVKEAKRIDR